MKVCSHINNILRLITSPIKQKCLVEVHSVMTLWVNSLEGNLLFQHWSAMCFKENGLYSTSTFSVSKQVFCAKKKRKRKRKHHIAWKSVLYLKTKIPEPLPQIITQLGLREDLRIYIPKCSINHSKNLVSLESLAYRKRRRKLMLETRKNMATLSVLVIQYKKLCIYKIGNE